MKTNVKKIVLSVITTLLLSAGFSHAADSISQEVDSTPSTALQDFDSFQDLPKGPLPVWPCEGDRPR